MNEGIIRLHREDRHCFSCGEHFSKKIDINTGDDHVGDHHRKRADERSVRCEGGCTYQVDDPKPHDGTHGQTHDDEYRTNVSDELVHRIGRHYFLLEEHATGKVTAVALYNLHARMS